MVFNWNEEKNTQLKKERNISFERIVLAIDEGSIVDILEHPNKEKFGKQISILINIENYIYVVPTVIEKDYWFFKTIFPSRKYTNEYLLGKRGEK